MYHLICSLSFWNILVSNDSSLAYLQNSPHCPFIPYHFYVLKS
jgi:hypothetical protein